MKLVSIKVPSVISFLVKTAAEAADSDEKDFDIAYARGPVGRSIRRSTRNARLGDFRRSFGEGPGGFRDISPDVGAVSEEPTLVGRIKTLLANAPERDTACLRTDDPESSEVRAALVDRIRRMRLMPEDRRKAYRSWWMETATPEMKRLFEEVEAEDF